MVLGEVAIWKCMEKPQTRLSVKERKIKTKKKSLFATSMMGDEICKAYIRIDI